MYGQAFVWPAENGAKELEADIKTASRLYEDCFQLVLKEMSMADSIIGRALF